MKDAAYPITLQQIYPALDEPIPAGARVVTDRLWPRGVKKAVLEAQQISWYNKASPSTTCTKHYCRAVRQRLPARAARQPPSPAAPDRTRSGRATCTVDCYAQPRANLSQCIANSFKGKAQCYPQQ